MNSTGFLEIILGPMFGGKTTQLINRYNEITDNLNSHSYSTIQPDVFTINYDKDTRYSTNQIVSHDGKTLDCNFIHELEDIDRNPKLLSKLNNSKFIFIDEAQFFKNLKNWVLYQLDHNNKHIILCGLDSDFKREKFGEILDLIPHSNKITKLTGTCSKCYNSSIYTHRISNEIEQEIIGNDKYIPVCRKCYNDLNK
uniref:thymidine kinase n=1 Tax=viral metagenome TaxID=1070528 RepID=A0A6C0AXF0_9ZZZZ|tara:strand:- start:79227 stop:79817 length:591 start_codon:yes stop_codon:yes gene_type:complete